MKLRIDCAIQHKSIKKTVRVEAVEFLFMIFVNDCR